VKFQIYLATSLHAAEITEKQHFPGQITQKIAFSGPDHNFKILVAGNRFLV
jgi:hypothetical protein